MPSFLMQVLPPPIGKTLVAHFSLRPAAPLSQNSVFLYQVQSTLQPQPCFILTPVVPACLHFLAKCTSPNRLPRSKVLPGILPQALTQTPGNADTGVLATGPRGMVVACSGWERICVQGFSDGWSFPASPRLGCGGIPALPCQPKPSLVSTPAVGCPNVQHT